jgi:hypothetical protein
MIHEAFPGLSPESDQPFFGAKSFGSKICGVPTKLMLKIEIALVVRHRLAEAGAI